MEPWLDGLWKAIKEALSKMNSDRIGHMKGGAQDSLKEAADSRSPDVQLNLLSITDQQDSGAPTSAASSSAPIAQSAVSDLRAVSPTRRSELASLSSDAASAPPSGTEPKKDDAELTHITPVSSLTHSLPPLSESSLNVPALPSPYLDVSLQQVETTEQVNSWVMESVFATF